MMTQDNSVTQLHEMSWQVGQISQKDPTSWLSLPTVSFTTPTLTLNDSFLLGSIHSTSKRQAVQDIYKDFSANVCFN